MTTAPEALQRLRLALEALTGALSSGDSAGVLAAEAPLSEAVRQLEAGLPVASLARAEVAREIGRLRSLLARCRALGASSADLLATLAPAEAYGRSGRARTR